MKNSCFIVLFLLGIIPSAFAQLIGFEEEVPEAFTVSGKGEVKISSLFYKEGESSLEWDFQPGSTLDVQIAPLSLNTRNEKQFGITLWIYNEKPQQDSIRFEFLNKEGEVSYWFSYRLQAAGWRACWISFEYMQGDKKDKKIVAYRLVAPQRKGRIFLDRLIFPEKKMNTGFIGTPIVAPDEQDKKKGEMSWNDIETMLSGFAYDAYYNQNETSKKNYFTVFDYAIDQGFAYGSGMGTNHHYGYQVRKIYTTAWLMRDAIYKHPHRDAYLSTLRFWAALQETRQPCSPTRDELLDSWHTLLMAKFISAMMFPDAREQAQALSGLSRWLSSSLRYTPGTIGGIKVDGTTFHHGGFYPGYTTGVLATVGEYIAFTNGTSFELTEDARKHMKSAFIAMRNYCNFYEWGIGISGRHPFGGKMGSDDIELLDSPLKGTTMARSKENFSGSSSLDGKNGMFAMKLAERDYENFTPDFVARKSVFCFDNRMVCLGTGISNSNVDYPTETTLFQTKYNGKEPKVGEDNYWLHDGYDNYYHVVDGTVRSQVAEQESRHEKTREVTKGKFSSAWIEYGKAPKEGTYEYMVLIQPSASDLDELRKTPAYEVLQRDQTAHVVYDKKTGITAYAAFEAYQPAADKVFVAIPAETMVMYAKESDKGIRLSVCDPNLNIEEKTYTTKEPSRPITKEIRLKGHWRLTSPMENVRLEQQGDQTVLTVTCQHGQPVEMLMENK